MNKKLTISRRLWRDLVSELRERGDGERESGAFLLGKDGSFRVKQFICYDDLDDRALESGIITFHANGFIELWNYCQKNGLKVLADVHTHPSSWVDQSESDRTHPMVAQRGHFALIIPDYAKPPVRSLSGVGIFEYLGNHRWQRHPSKKSPVKITIL